MALNYRLPPVETIPTLPQAEKAAIFDCLFEPSAQLRNLCKPSLDDQRFFNYKDLVTFVESRLTRLSTSTDRTDIGTLDEILGSHPRLGAQRVESTQSQSEQAQLRSEDETESNQLAEMNARYEKAFPGLRYVTFVDGRPRPIILEDMKNRIEHHSIDSERALAIKAMCDIALDRALKLSVE